MLIDKHMKFTSNFLQLLLRDGRDSCPVKRQRQLIITVGAVSTAAPCSRKPLICIHVELQCSLGSGTVGIGFGVCDHSHRTSPELSESPITVLELLEEFFDDFYSV